MLVSIYTHCQCTVGTSVEIYGAPPHQLESLGHLPGTLELCLQGECHSLDSEEKYDAAEYEAPVLLWSYNSLNAAHDHHLEVRLLDTNGDNNRLHGLTIHHIVYYDRAPVFP
jgi:hypothetical protein